MRRILPLSAAIGTCSLLIAAAPHGWGLAGSRPTAYDTGVDPVVLYAGAPSAFLRSKENPVKGFGTLMQSIAADDYRGKRIRFSGYVRADQVKEGAGLWMRVDKERESVAFDNMQNRPIKGTSDWLQYAVVLDVPSDATGIFFGILLTETGTVWLSGVKFEVVGTDVPTTSSSTGSRVPVNLDFALP